MTHPTLEHAIVLHISEMEGQHGLFNSYVHTRKLILRKFQLHADVTLLTDIQPYHTNSFIEKHPGAYSFHLHEFLKWTHERFHHPPYVDPRPTSAQRRNLQPRIARDFVRQEARWRATVEHCASKMKFPHQKAVFLLGYLYGLRLRDIYKLKLDDLAGLGPLRKDLYDLLDDLNRTDPIEDRPIFRPWLGPSVWTAQRAWKKWVGKGKSFAHIRLAGDLDLFDSGFRPRFLKGSLAPKLIRRMAPPRVEGAEKMKWFWGMEPGMKFTKS